MSVLSKTFFRSHMYLGAVVFSGLFLYLNLVPLSEYIVSIFPVERDSHLGEALTFFIYDTPKVLLLLSGVVFSMGIINTWFTPGPF